ncbi:cysteinyl-tRNA synthetase [Chrysochromulina tobinii]|uniref:cysteine--tRNA ligase n=1 Tax=Chrysochromulina tobinii TaxID=1460289 RepID=A0A0M0JNV1_9EUKA|nr:cysteinyl-tRNA synthetase [Chrysochromulina tobinii]|eukprot:KOO28165.1 cysteinyl-tRNA synthetase [Chrysochromulina sp. CCMP291]
MMAILLSTLVLTRPRAAAVGSAVSRGAIAGVLRVRRHTTSLRTAIRMQQGSLVEAPPSRAGASPDLLTGAASAEGLHLLNSLTQTVEAFTPIDPRLVKWYVCGPTVYDSAHVGHARNYVAFDIVRRVLLDYFGFDLLYVMNITDIDDKIIVRTHYNHLESMAAEAVLATPKPGLRDLLEAQHVLAAAAEAAAVPLPVCDVQAAFLELTAAFEAEFFDDMARLNVLPPDAVTRVSDYVPEIIAYIETIRSNGYCYESRGSVYFDTEAFRNAPGKQYGKLDPAKAAAGQRAGAGADDEADDWTEGKSSAQLLAEGEGALSADAAADKRHPADFVLWKASKAGEPSWASPWGLGRPGWHIECSAMASDLLGSHVDLNAGGVDLKFPHHENQIAQAEAHFDCCSWVNYFLHSGHLRIEGLKMSKSLKNFITIDGALSQYSAAQLRFLFLLRRFSEPMEYSENTLAAAIATHKWGAEERTLHATLHSRRQAVHSALLDSIDTPTAFKALEQLLRATNVYMSEVPDVTRGFTLLTLVQRYFGRMFQVFGLPSLFADGGVGAGGAGAAGGGASAEQVALALSTFRDQLRQKAIAAVKAAKGAEGGAPDTALAEELLRLCDALRDDVLPQLGVQLDDRPSGVAQLQMRDPKVLTAEMEL